MKLTFGALLFITCFSVQAATVTFYTDRASFEAALSSHSTIDFEDVAPAGGYVTYDQSMFDVNFTGNTLRVVDENPSGGWSNAPFESDMLRNTYSYPLSADLTSAGSGITAAGGWFGVAVSGNAHQDVATTLTLTLLSGATYTENVMAGNTYTGKPETFFGWTVAGDEIVGITHNTSGAAWESVDNFTYGFAATVPIPSAMWLFGSALGLSGWIRRKTV